MACGRPTRFTKKMGDEICERLAEGESLRSICRDDHIAHRGNVFRWLLSDKKIYSTFRDQYALAREIQAECLIDDIFDIADDSTNDYMENRQAKDSDDAPMVVNPEAIGRARLRVDTRKWHASRIITRYKDKQEKEAAVIVQNIMPVPTADSVDSWEQIASKQQEKALEG